MKAIRYDAPRSWTLAEVPTPEPGPGEVVVRVARCGVCGTDLHLDRGEFDPRYPLTPGHEIVGYVEVIGASTDGRLETLRPGDPVAVDNMTACGSCPQCQRARPQFCARMTARGVNLPGGFAERVLVPAGKCHPLGELPMEVAVLAEPLACVVHGLDILRPRVGSDALVIGVGPTGLLLAQLLRIAGCARVTVAGRRPAKLELARHYGADQTLRLGAGGIEAARPALRDIAPDGFDLVVDATGSVDVLAAATDELAIGATLFVYGMTAQSARLSISPYDVFRRELSIRGSFSQAFSVGRAVELLRAGRIQTDGMISRQLPLDRYREALDAMSGDPDCVKVVLAP